MFNDYCAMPLAIWRLILQPLCEDVVGGVHIGETIGDLSYDVTVALIAPIVTVMVVGSIKTKLNLQHIVNMSKVISF